MKIPRVSWNHHPAAPRIATAGALRTGSIGSHCSSVRSFGSRAAADTGPAHARFRPKLAGRMAPMLIVMAGLPGSGKSAVAGEVARTLACALLSVDPIEAAMWQAGVARDQPTGLAAYVVAEELAQEQLLIGNDVIVDAVNDVEPAREQWRSLAARLDEPLAFVEVFCSDEQEHRRRLTGRRREITGFPEPTWGSVIERRKGFTDWDDDRVRVNSMRPLEEGVASVLEYLWSIRRSGLVDH